MKQALLLILFFGFSLTLWGQSGQAEDLRAFPNPVVSSFQIGYSEQVQSIRVMNMFGREVTQFAYQQGGQYDVSNLPRGMYLIQLRNRENQVIRTQRLQKQ